MQLKWADMHLSLQLQETSPIYSWEMVIPSLSSWASTDPMCPYVSNFCIRTLVSFIDMWDLGLFKPIQTLKFAMFCVFSSQMTLDGWNELGMLGQTLPCGGYSVKGVSFAFWDSPFMFTKWGTGFWRIYNYIIFSTDCATSLTCGLWLATSFYSQGHLSKLILILISCSCNYMHVTHTHNYI